MGLFDLFRRTPTREKVTAFYRLAEDKAYDDLLKNIVHGVPSRSDRDLYADAFFGVLSQRENLNELAANVAWKATLKHFKMSEQTMITLLKGGTSDV